MNKMLPLSASHIVFPQLARNFKLFEGEWSTPVVRDEDVGLDVADASSFTP